MGHRNCGICIYHSGRKYCCKNHYTECSDFERKNMLNIKITAEVDGKQVPLDNISTETFEAIKALEKPKEIPVARLATNGSYGRQRLIFKVTEGISERKGLYVAIDLMKGRVQGYWPGDDGNCGRDYGFNYENIKPL